MKITTLIENHENCEKGLRGEHGLSILVQCEEKNILFDTGQTGAFIDNAKKMHVNLRSVDSLVLSHGHHDHSGGVMRFLKEENEKADIYLGKGYFMPKYVQRSEGGIRYNGNAFSQEEFDNLVRNQNRKVIGIEEEVYRLTRQVYLVAGIPMTNSQEQLNPFFYLKNSDYEQDTFQDEIVMVAEREKGLVVIAGCSHRGIMNIITAVEEKFGRPVIGVIGGTHLIKAGQERLNYTIAELKKRNLEFLAVSHCTGEENIDRLQKEFGDRFIRNITGNTITLS